MRKGHRPSKPPSNRPRFWGRHAVSAALANPNRVVRKLWATREAASALDIPSSLTVAFAEAADLGRMVPGDAPHQGLVLEVDPLEDVWLGDLLAEGAGDQRPLLLLDQVQIPTMWVPFYVLLRRSMRSESLHKTGTPHPNQARWHGLLPARWKLCLGCGS